MDIHKISAYLTGRSPIAAQAILYLRKTLLVHMLHCAEGLYSKSRHAAETEQFELFYQEHKEQFKKVYHLLADDESRETYKAVVKFRMNRDFREIKHHIYYPQYFVKGIINCQKEVFVDGGAYIGDSIFALLKYAPAEEIHKIYAWEPDKENGEALSRNLDRIQKKNTVAVEWIPCALYREQSLLTFDSGAGQSSKIGDGGISVPADTIDHRCPDATFIKMDLEGAEIDALYGAKNTIIQNKPKLAISIYHTSEHLYEIPLLIHKWVPEYKLYVRHHTDTCADTVLYAVV